MNTTNYYDEFYYFGGTQEAPFGNASIFPLRKEDIGGSGNVDPTQKEVTYTENGVNVVKPSDGFDGLSSVKVEVNVPIPSIKQDSVNILYNKEGVYTINASQYGVDGLSSVTVTVAIPVSEFFFTDGTSAVSYDTVITSNSYDQELELESVNIGNGVTSIGNRAFDSCTGLTSVTIPNSVTSIGEDAFYYCISLASIEIPNSVTSIGDTAFDGCRSLTSVTISDGVTSIGYMAFNGCSGLTSVTIPDSVTSIENYAFNDIETVQLESTIPFKMTNEYGLAIKSFGDIGGGGSGSGSGSGGRDLKIYVPAEAYDAYYNSTDAGWVYYKSCLVAPN